MRKRFLAESLLVGVTLAWGLTFPLIKEAVTAVPPLFFVAVRFTIAAGVLWAVLALRRPVEIPWRRGVVLGVCLYAAYALQTLGLQHTSSANAGFITGISVAIVPVFAYLLEKIPLSKGGGTGLVLAVVGLGLISQTGEFSVRSGDLLVLGCAVALALQIVLTSRYAPDADPTALASVQILSCGGLALVSSAIFEGSRARAAFAMLAQPRVSGSVLFCALVATAAAYLIQTKFQQQTTPFRTAMIFATEPVFASVFAYFIAGEVLTVIQVLGCALLLASMLAVDVVDRFG